MAIRRRHHRKSTDDDRRSLAKVARRERERAVLRGLRALRVRCALSVLSRRSAVRAHQASVRSSTNTRREPQSRARRTLPLSPRAAHFPTIVASSGCQHPRRRAPTDTRITGKFFGRFLCALSILPKRYLSRAKACTMRR